MTQPRYYAPRGGLLAQTDLTTDRATFTEPHQLSVGVRDVWVNGGRVLAAGAHTGAMAGRVVDGPGR